MPMQSNVTIVPYTIRSFDPVSGSITVEYASGSIVALTIPADSSGALLTGNALASFVSSFATTLPPPFTNANAISTLVVPMPAPEPTWTSVRQQRNRLLQASDWTQLADVPDSGDRLAWASYRQTLRDIPQTFSTANAVVYPSAPVANTTG